MEVQYVFIKMSYNSDQNNFGKIKKSSKNGQEKRTLMSASA